MRLKEYKQSSFSAIRMIVMSIGLIAAMLFLLVKKNELTTKEIFIYSLGFILFGTGLIVGVMNVLTNKKQTLVLNEKGFLFRLYKQGHKIEFILISGLGYAMLLFACITLSLALSNNLNLFVKYWQINILGFFMLVVIGGLTKYYKYRRILG